MQRKELCDNHTAPFSGFKQESYSSHSISSQEKHIALFRQAHPQTENRREGSTQGEDSGQEHSIVRSGIAKQMEEQGHQCSPYGLPRKTSGGKHAAGTTGTLRRRRGEQHVVVGRLEKPEAHAAKHQSPHESEMVGIGGYERETETADTHDNQPHPAQDSGVYLPDKYPCQRSDKDNDQRPRGHQQPGTYGVIVKGIDQQERHGHQTHNLEVPGSSPGWSTLRIKHLRAIASVFFFFCVNNA